MQTGQIIFAPAVHEFRFVHSPHNKMDLGHILTRREIRYIPKRKKKKNWTIQTETQVSGFVFQNWMNKAKKKRQRQDSADKKANNMTIRAEMLTEILRQQIENFD